MNKISNNNISFVIQGVCDVESINRNIKKIKKLFPGSEIIVSTWKDSNGVDKIIGYDQIILSDILDETYYAKYIDYANNFHRMMKTSYEGIKAAKNEYVFRMRSDLIFKNKKFLKKYEKFCSKNPSTIFSNRILVMESHIGLAINNHFLPVPFHAADWINFGLKDDLLKIWNGTDDMEEMTEEKLTDLNFYNEDFRKLTIPSELWLFRKYFNYKNFVYSEPSEILSNTWKDFCDKNLFIINIRDVYLISTKYRLHTSKFFPRISMIPFIESYRKNSKFFNYLIQNQWYNYFRRKLL